MSTIAIGFCAYLVIILLVGLAAFKKTRNMHDFALGGHRLSGRLLAVSERASGESAWLLVGLPGAALVGGLLEFWTVVGVISGTICSWYIVAGKLRELTAKHSALTLPDVLSKTFGNSKEIRVVASAIITFFFTFYVAAQFSGAGKVLNISFDLEPLHGMLLGAAIIVLYTLLGGFIAVVWTDVVQGILMIGTLVVLPTVAFFHYLTLAEGSPVGQAQLFDWNTLVSGESPFAIFSGIVGGLSWGIGYLGQPHLVNRFMALPSAESVKQGRVVAIAWSFPAFIGAMMIGLIGSQLLQMGWLSADGEVIATLADKEQLMPLMATSLLPAWVAGILISGAIAAMMSTADSQLLVTSTVITEDVAKHVLKRDYSTRQFLNFGRIVTLAVGCLAFFMAIRTKDFVFETVSYAWGGLGASFAPAVILTLWWRKTSKAGVLASMVCGTFFTVFDVSFGTITTRLSAFVIAFLAAIIASLWFPDSPKPQDTKEA